MLVGVSTRIIQYPRVHIDRKRIDMRFFGDEDVSLGLTSIFGKIVGFWLAADRAEQRIRNYTQIYTLIAILFGMWIQIRDIYYSWGDFSACLFTACNILSVTMALFKLVVLLAHKKDFFWLILCIQKKFLHGDYDEYERKILFACKRQCTIFVCFLICSTKATLISYVINPLIGNIGRNESDRILPFNMWVNLPLTTSPYYEITFALQAISLYYIGVSYFCFDNFLCIMNLHAASQFRILQYRLENMVALKKQEEKVQEEKSAMDTSSFAHKYYVVFKNYVRQHQALIDYCEKLEGVFSLIVLGQVLMFSMLICLDGYQILMPEVPTKRRITFALHLSACLCQLLMFTYSCDSIIQESTSIAEAVYKGPWCLLPETTSGRMLRKDMIIVILRSSIPCRLTAKGFFVVSLETYTGVLSTAVSYFTLLQQSSEAISS